MSPCRPVTGAHRCAGVPLPPIGSAVRGPLAPSSPGLMQPPGDQAVDKRSGVRYGEYVTRICLHVGDPL